jgi:two-component system KDP operon response regulator KdpE
LSRASRILLADDETSIQRALERCCGPGHEVGGRDGEGRAGGHRERGPDLVILDLGLPDMDGLDVCTRVRERWEMPIIVLSARGAEQQKIAALDLGADDYITKPFGPEELLARVRVALRRSLAGEEIASGQAAHGDLVIDFDRRRVIRKGEEIRLTPKEFELLTLMASRPGQVLTHRMILKKIWGPNAVDQPEHLRVLMAQLRKKIEPDPAQPQYLLTEPWVGYRFAEDPA